LLINGLVFTSASIQPTFTDPLSLAVQGTVGATSTIAAAATSNQFSNSTQTTNGARSLAIQGNVGWNQNWTVSPMSDPDVISRLRTLFQYATHNIDLCTFYRSYPIQSSGQGVTVKFPKCAEDGKSDFVRDGVNPSFLEKPNCVICVDHAVTDVLPDEQTTEADEKQKTERVKQIDKRFSAQITLCSKLHAAGFDDCERDRYQKMAEFVSPPHPPETAYLNEKIRCGKDTSTPVEHPCDWFQVEKFGESTSGNKVFIIRDGFKSLFVDESKGGLESFHELSLLVLQSIALAPVVAAGSQSAPSTPGSRKNITPGPKTVPTLQLLNGVLVQ
jgi:hypothetical protein